MNAATLPALMLTMAQSRQVDPILASLATGVAACPRVVLVRLWLLAPGDICQACRMAPECANRDRCLHLVASAGNPQGGGVYSRLDGDFRRYPLGQKKVGEVAATGTPLLVRHLRGDETWLANPGWARSQGVRTVAAQPLVFRGETLGVLALFDREVLDDEQVTWLRLFADHAAVSIANARVFEHVAEAHARLEAENTLLRAEIRGAAGRAAIVSNATPDHESTLDASSDAPELPGPMTRDELRELEKRNIARALDACGGRVFGPRGAAARLGMKPTTLASRIKTLGLGRMRA